MTNERAFRVLEVPASAGAAEVRQAYRDLVKVWHPDRFERDVRLRAKAGLRLAEINAAYRLLTAVPAPSTRPTAASGENPFVAAAPRSRRPTPPPARARASWSGVAATAALLFGAACVALALVLTSTPVI